MPRHPVSSQPEGPLPTASPLARLPHSASRLGLAIRNALLGPPAEHTTERNLWCLCVEVAWAGVLAAAASFNAAFAVRLGASSAWIGYLTSAPALVAVIMYIPSALVLERQARRLPWILGSLALVRLGYGFIVVLPSLLAAQRAEMLVITLIAISVPQTLFSAGWNPMLADVIPQRERTRIIAWRTMLHSTTVASLTLLAGWWLDASARWPWAAFPRNYQLVYALGFVGAVISTLYVGTLRLPPAQVTPRSEAKGSKSLVDEVVTMFRTQREYRAMVVNTLVLDSGAWLAAPLYIIFFVRELGAGDGWVGLNTTLANVAVIVGYMLWRRAMRRLGYSLGLLVSAPLAASYAFLVALVPNLGLILVWGVLINLINPGLSLSHFNILLQVCPEARRPTYLATFSTVMNLGAFLLPMVGVALAGVWGIRNTLLLAGSLRLLGAMLFHMNRVRVPQIEIA